RGLVEMLAALGVADRIQSYSTLGHSHYEVLEKYEEAVSKVPKGSDGLFSREAVVAKDPDFFYSDMNYGNDMVEVYQPLDIPILFSTRWCPKFAPKKDGDPDLIEAQYQEIADLGRAFNVVDKADDVINSLKERIGKAHDIAQEHEPIDVASIAFYDGV